MTTERPKRRWYQFSLRTLLVFVLLVSIGLSWFALKLQQARKQREAVRVIEKLGGEVEYDYELHEQLSMQPPEPTQPAWLRGLLGIDFFADVACVSWSGLGIGPGATGAGLEHLKGLPALISLDLKHTQVTDEGVKKLKQAFPNCEIEH